MTKNISIYENKHLPNWNIWLAEHLPVNNLSILVAFYSGSNFPKNVYIRVQQDKGLKQMWVFLTHLKLWVAVARYSFKRVKI